MWTEEENAGISSAMNHYDRHAMIGHHPLEAGLNGRGPRALIDGLFPSCQSAQTASANGEFQTADFLRGMRSTEV